MPPLQVVSRKRTASEANLAEERAPKRHQTDKPRPLSQPHHIKRFNPPPPRVEERPNLFSRAFSCVKDFWNHLYIPVPPCRDPPIPGAFPYHDKSTETLSSSSSQAPQQNAPNSNSDAHLQLPSTLSPRPYPYYMAGGIDTRPCNSKPAASDKENQVMPRTDSENEDANSSPPHLRPDYQSHSNLGTYSPAMSSAESLDSTHLPEPNPHERLFSSIPAVPHPPLARTVGGSLAMHSECILLTLDRTAHTFEPLPCLPTLPSLGPAAPPSTPTQPTSKGDAIVFGGSTSQLLFSQAASSSELAPSNAQMQPSSPPPAQVEDADEELVIRPIKKVPLAFTKFKSPEPAPECFDPYAHLRVPIAAGDFSTIQEGEGPGLLPELQLNTQESVEFWVKLEDYLRELVETENAKIVEAPGCWSAARPELFSLLRDADPSSTQGHHTTHPSQNYGVSLHSKSAHAESSPRKPGRGLKADESASPRKIARTESTENIAGPSDAFAVMVADHQLADTKKDKHRQRTTAERGESEAIEKEPIADEAHGSDDELDFGFGKTQKTDDEEAQGDKPTTEDKAAVDDRVFRAHELREDAVIEKDKERLEDDDATLQKIHEAAVAGKPHGGKNGGKKGGWDVALSDSESEDGEYRRPKGKKQKAAGDKSKGLAHDDETKNPNAAYQNDLEDQDDDLKHLNIAHDYSPGIKDAADPLGGKDMGVEGEIQEASWKRGIGAPDPHVEEVEEHHSSPEPSTSKGNGPDVYVYSSFFYSKLLESDCYQRGKIFKWTKDVNIFEKDIAFLPINKDNKGSTHWTTGAINFQLKRFEYHDSMGTKDPVVFKTLREYVRRLYKEVNEGEEFDFTDWEDCFDPNSPRQHNGFDCGIFVYQAMENLLRGAQAAFNLTKEI